MSIDLTGRIANRIFNARKEKMFTQKQVADALGISEGQYAHYEKGRAKPDINTIYQMCILFNASFDEWLGLTENSVEKKESPASAKPKARDKYGISREEYEMFSRFLSGRGINSSQELTATQKKGIKAVSLMLDCLFPVSSAKIDTDDVPTANVG